MRLFLVSLAVLGVSALAGCTTVDGKKPSPVVQQPPQLQSDELASAKETTVRHHLGLIKQLYHQNRMLEDIAPAKKGAETQPSEMPRRDGSKDAAMRYAQYLTTLDLDLLKKIQALETDQNSLLESINAEAKPK